MRPNPDPLGNWDSIRQQLDREDVSPGRRLQLAQQVALRWPNELLEHARSVNVGSEEDRLQLALTVIANPSVTAQTIDVSMLPHTFGLNTTVARVRLLSSLLERHDLDLTDCLVKLGLMERRDLALDSGAWRFQLHGQPAALSVAKSLLEFYEPDHLRPALMDVYDPVGTVCAALDAPDLRDHDRIELARLVARRSDSQSLINRIENFEAPEVRKELGLSIARHSHRRHLKFFSEVTGDPMAVAFAQQELRMRLLTAAKVSELSDVELTRHLELWQRDLTPQHQSQLFANGIRLAGRIDEEQGLPLSTLHNALVDVHRPQIVTYDAAFPEESAAYAAALLNMQSPLDRLLVQAAEIQVEEHRHALCEWIISVAFMLGDQESTAMALMAPTIERLSSVRPPELRTELMRAFSDSVHVADAEAVVKFANSGQFHRPHMQIFAVALGRLYASDAAVLPEPLRKVLSHSKFKDGKHLQAVSHDLMVIVGSGVLPLGARRRLIELSAPTSGTVNETVEGFIKTLKLLAVAVRAIDSQMLDRDDAKSALSEVSSCEHLGLVLGMLARRVTPGSLAHRESDAPEMRENWDRFMTESRRPEALLAYAQLVRSSLQATDSDDDSDNGSDLASDDDRPDLLATIDLFADAVVWSADKKDAFAKLRYDTQASTHLAEIAERAPSTWAAWREEVTAQRIDSQGSGGRSVTVDPMQYLRQRIVQDAHVPAQTYPGLERVLRGTLDINDAVRAAESGSDEERLLQLLNPAATAQQRTRLLHEIVARLPVGSQFRRDLEDLRGRINAKPVSIRGLTIVDTDDAEDLLLCGTEIAGSCQSVDGDLEVNKALMGYVVDGKYRMLAAKDDGGQLVARRMLRLLCDEDGQPALLLEGLYANVGVETGDQWDEALIDLAKKKATSMGCRLLSDGEDLTVDRDLPCTLSSKDSRAPFEYVDAHGLQVQERSYDLVAWPVK